MELLETRGNSGQKKDSPNGQVFVSLTPIIWLFCRMQVFRAASNWRSWYRLDRRIFPWAHFVLASPGIWLRSHRRGIHRGYLRHSALHRSRVLWWWISRGRRSGRWAMTSYSISVVPRGVPLRRAHVQKGTSCRSGVGWAAWSRLRPWSGCLSTEGCRDSPHCIWQKLQRSS